MNNVNDIHLLSGAYAVDALDNDERTAFKAHLETCSSCRVEVIGLREAAIAIAGVAPIEPPIELRSRLLAAVSQTRQLPPIVSEPAQPPFAEPASDPSEATILPVAASVMVPHQAEPADSAESARSAEQNSPNDASVAIPGAQSTVIPLSRRQRARRGWALVAAAAVLIASVGAWRPWQDSDQVGPVDSIMAAADVQKMEEVLPDGGSMTVYRSVSLDKAAVVTHNLPSAGPGKIYEVWFQDDAGSMIPAAVLPTNKSVEVVLLGSASEATAAGVTVEPVGGSPSPTSDPVMLFEFEES